MPINVAIGGTPKFETSLVKYVVDSLNRIRDALSTQAVGGPGLQEGSFSVNCVAVAVVNGSNAFPTVMANPPHMFATLVGWTVGTPEMVFNIKRVSGLGFDWRLTFDAAYTGVITVAWIAIPR